MIEELACVACCRRVKSNKTSVVADDQPLEDAPRLRIAWFLRTGRCDRRGHWLWPRDRPFFAQGEYDGNDHTHVHRPPIDRTWFEPPFLHRSNCGWSKCFI